MSKTNIGLVAFAKAALAAHLGYVYGTFGQMCNSTLLDQKAKQYPDNNLAGGQMRTVGNKWIGRRVVDCSGLIKYYLMADKVGDNLTYNARYDTNLFNASSEKGPISTIPEIPGIALYMPGHTAVYVGNGHVIESAGTAYGVVQSKLPRCYTGRSWTHWYKVPGIEYLKTQSVTGPHVSGIVGLSLDTRSKNMRPGEVYEVLARCSNQPEINVTGQDVIKVERITADPRGWKIRTRAIKSGFAHITVASAGLTAQCNFNVRC